MEKINITFSGKWIFISIAIFIIFAIFMFGSQTGKEKIIGKVDAISLEDKFNTLNSAGTNFCAGSNILDNFEGVSLQGACCGKMDFHRYVEQVEGLKKYSYIDKIPPDPYDISKSLAEEFLNYQKTIKLTLGQQEVYDKATELSHEGGPCCCKCWRWYAFEGLAKYLITEYNFTAEQIAEVWDLEDGCGGSGHSHGDQHTE